eukprot:scaffold11312_cov69-Phaeocystis_antarctica.AAC.5
MGGNGGRRGSISGPGGGAAGGDSVCRLIGGNGGRRGFTAASVAFQAMPMTFSRSALARPAGKNGRRSWQNSGRRRGSRPRRGWPLGRQPTAAAAAAAAAAALPLQRCRSGGRCHVAGGGDRSGAVRRYV